MAFLSARRAAKRNDYRTEAIDVIDSRPGCRFVAWGLPFLMSLAHAVPGSHKPLDRGRRFDLSSSAILEWEYDPRTDQSEFGQMKERIVLDRKPGNSFFSFQLQAIPGCTFSYQPPLTPKETAEGCVRPDNVVGSYAMFGPSGEKIGHFYRPWAKDNGERFVWCELDVSPQGRSGNWDLTITVPDAFLADAAYPVVVDPTFGYTTTGGTEVLFGGNAIRGFGPWSPVENAAINSVSLYFRAVNAVLGTFGVYDGDADHTPSTRLVDGAGISIPAGTAWVTDTMDSAPNIYAVNSYYFGVNRYTANLGYVYYDVLVGKHYRSASQVYSHGALTYSPSWSGWVADRAYSIYGTYTTDSYAAGAPEMRRLSMVRGFRPGAGGIF